MFGLHKVGDVQFIAMQYVEGRNVRQLVDGKPLDLDKALAKVPEDRYRRPAGLMRPNRSR